MRIAHVITRMIIGGAQENTLLCCADLVRDYGDQVLLITGPALGPEGDLLAQATPPDVPVALLPQMRRPIHPLRDVQAYRSLKKTLREFRPDVVHTHSAKAGLLGRMAASSLEVPAIIHTVHGAPFHAFQNAASRSFFRACERFAARRCHMLVSVADAMTDQLVAAGVAPREQFITIYSGMEVEPLLQADQQRQAMRQQLGYQEEDVVVGKIARLFHLKGHQYLVDAAVRLVPRYPNLRFLLVGDGILRAAIQRQIAEAGLSDHFQFVGLVPPQQIPAMLSAMDLLVHASLREGLARALPQALIAGKPVVSFDVDGAAEVVIPGQTGYLVPPRAVQPLVDAIARLAGDALLRERLGQQGRTRFVEQFRHQYMTQQLRTLYRRVLERQGAG